MNEQSPETEHLGLNVPYNDPYMDQTTKYLLEAGGAQTVT